MSPHIGTVAQASFDALAICVGSVHGHDLDDLIDATLAIVQARLDQPDTAPTTTLLPGTLIRCGLARFPKP